MILLLSEGFAFHVCLYDFITTSEYEDLEKEKRNFIKCIKYTNIILNAAPVPSQLLPLLQMIYWCQYVCVLCLIMCFNLKTPTRHLLAPLFDYFKLKDCPGFVDLKYFLLKGILRKNSRASVLFIYRFMLKVISFALYRIIIISETINLFPFV